MASSSRTRRALPHALLWSAALLPFTLLPFDPENLEFALPAATVAGTIVWAWWRNPAAGPTGRQTLLALAASGLAVGLLLWRGVEARQGAIGAAALGLFGVWQARSARATAATLAAMAAAAAALLVQHPVADVAVRWLWAGAIFCFVYGAFYLDASAGAAGPTAGELNRPAAEPSQSAS